MTDTPLDQADARTRALILIICDTADLPPDTVTDIALAIDRELPSYGWTFTPTRKQQP